MRLWNVLIGGGALLVAPAGAQKAASVPAALKAPSTPDAVRDLERAELMVKEGYEKEALVSLTDFLRRYPKHAKAGEAQFLIGEIHFKRREFAQARQEFLQVMESYPKSPRVADAVFWLGESWLKEGRSVRARIEWEALRRAHPKSAAAARAEERLLGLPALEQSPQAENPGSPES